MSGLVRYVVGNLKHGLRMPFDPSMSSSGSRRARVRNALNFIISETWDEVAFTKSWPDWTYVPDWGALNRLGALTCWAVGHAPVPAHCNRAAHDYCEVCNSPTSGAAPHRRLPTTGTTAT